MVNKGFIKTSNKEIYYCHACLDEKGEVTKLKQFEDTFRWYCPRCGGGARHWLIDKEELKEIITKKLKRLKKLADRYCK